jgi:hypothetical protein
LPCYLVRNHQNWVLEQIIKASQWQKAWEGGKKLGYCSPAKINPCFITNWRRCDQDNHCRFWIALPPKKWTIVVGKRKKNKKELEVIDHYLLNQSPL